MKLIVDISEEDYKVICENYSMLEKQGAIHSDTPEQIAFNAIAKGDRYSSLGVSFPLVHPYSIPTPYTTWSTTTNPYVPF